MGTTPQRLCRRHGAVDSELAGLVRGGADHAPRLGVACDDDGFASQLGSIALLHGGIEGVHVHVNDLMGPLGIHVLDSFQRLFYQSNDREQRL